MGEVEFEKVAAEGAQEGGGDAGGIEGKQTDFGKGEFFQLGEHCFKFV
jgi:hypothetical protein